jgi:peptidoglycan L-alanyl-D-glutamate endopeptidase CwlK
MVTPDLLPDRDQSKLSTWTLHPQLLDAYCRIHPAMAAFMRPIFLVYVGRSTEEQMALYAKGRTAPGRIVTYADGVGKRSKHQVQMDGYVHAIDFAFVDDPRTPLDETYSPDAPWPVVGAMAESLRLTWGGRFAMLDLGHIELKG